MTLAPLVAALMAAVSPAAASSPDGQAITAAVAQAVDEDLARGYVDAPLEAAVLVTYAWRESRFRLAPAPESWDARAGRSCGPWQEPCAFVRTHSVLEQARWWLRAMHASSLAGVDSSRSRARARLVVAMGLLERVEGLAERQPP